VTLWTPANLLTTPQVILDPSVASWSGSNWGSTVNTGTGGGTIIASLGTPVKGTQLNGFDVVHFVETALQTTQNWTGGVDYFIFSVCRATAITGTNTVNNPLMSHLWDNSETATTGFVCYSRIAAGGTIAGDGTWVASDLVTFGEGFGSGTTAGYVFDHSQPFAAGTYTIFAMEAPGTLVYRINGSVVTPTSSSTGTADAKSGIAMIFGAASAGVETMIGDIAYLIVFAGAPSLADTQKLEGWAAWKYGLQANLPGGHPYKSAAPTLPGAMVLTQQQIIMM
jgi:hypothetical protein